MTEIVTIAKSSTGAVRSHGFPVLEAGNLAFPEGKYCVEFEGGKDRASFKLIHKVQGAPLISRLLEGGDAYCLCSVSAPLSLYRAVHQAKRKEQSHEVRWAIENLGEPPLLTPLVVSAVSRDLKLSTKRDGVHELWDSKKVSLVKGLKLAIGPVVQLLSSVTHLLSFQRDDSLPSGNFFVEPDTQNGFQFLVKLSSDLHAELRHCQNREWRASVITHIVTSCFALLQRDLKVQENDDEDNSWKSNRVLCALSDLLEAKNLPNWGSGDFRPEKVATTLFPHIPPKIQGEQGE